MRFADYNNEEKIKDESKHENRIEEQLFEATEKWAIVATGARNRSRAFYGWEVLVADECFPLRKLEQVPTSHLRLN